MRQKEVSILSEIKGKTEREKWTRKAKMVVSDLWSHFCLEKCFK
jgi:hypothetical protein